MYVWAKCDVVLTDNVRQPGSDTDSDDVSTSSRVQATTADEHSPRVQRAEAWVRQLPADTLPTTRYNVSVPVLLYTSYRVRQ